MTPDDYARYQRQIHLPAIGESGQQALLDARVLIIGMGGLGSPAALYLAAAGIGTLAIADFDRVEPSNLQRQIIHGEEDLNEPKAHSALRRIKSLNSACRVIPLDWALDEEELSGQIAQADLVLDCCDNFSTRFAVNRACHAKGVPLVSGAAIRTEGQVATFFPDRGACYQCLYPQTLENHETCAMEGVLAPVVGVIGSMQALQAVNVLTGNQEELVGKLLIFDGIAMAWQTLTIPSDPQCAVCSV